MKNLLILCLGNICRSPMAEAYLRKELLGKDYQISSAGIHALVGRSADPLAQEVILEQVGIDISAHRAQQVTLEQLLKSDLILVMEEAQRLELEHKVPVIKGRVMRIGKWSGFDIIDPYRRPKQVFEQSFALIKQCSLDWSSHL